MKILHETENLYLNHKLEICLNGKTHAVVIGVAKNIDHAKSVMEKLEKYPKYLRQMYDHN